MTSAIDVVRAYHDAFSKKDLTALRAVLSDDFTFHGPMMTAASGDEFVSQFEHFPFTMQFDSSRMIVDGDNVAHLFDFVVIAPAEGRVRMCECFEVKDGKIKSSELYFDPATFPNPEA